MSENTRKRVSKWDLVAESHFPDDNTQGNDQANRLEWPCSRSSQTHVSNWPDMEVGETMKYTDDPGNPMHESKGGMKEARTHREGSPSAGVWGANEDNNVSLLPGLHSRMEQSHSGSPKSRWSSSLRRSRSRSPVHTFKDHEERWTDKSKTGQRGSNIPCKDFASGRYKRGSQCRYAHDYSDGRRHDDWSPTGERVVGEHKIGNSSGYPCATGEAFTDSLDPERDGSRSSIPSNDFEKGRSRRGSPYKNFHQGDSNGGGYNGTMSRVYDRRDGDLSSGHDHRHGREPRRSRISEIPCKFFAEGRCRNGENCRFLHKGVVRGGLQVEPHDVWRGHSSAIDDRLCEGLKKGENSGSENVKDFRWGEKNDSRVGRFPEGSRSCDGARWGNDASDKHVPFPSQQVKRDEDNRGILEKPRRGEESHSIDTGDSVLNVQDSLGYQNAEDVKHQVIRRELPNEMTLSANFTGGQSQLCFPQPPTSGGQRFDLNRLSPLMIFSSPDRQNFNSKPPSNINLLPLPIMESVEKLELPNSNVSQTKSEAPTVASLVSSDQVAQLTHISASLALILANGQNLPQLYDSHNPPKAQSNLSSGLQQNQYDPLSDSVEPINPVSDQSFKFSSILEKKHSTIEKSQELVENLAPSFGIAGATEGSPKKNGVSEENQLQNDDHELKQLKQCNETGGVKKMGEETTNQNMKEELQGSHIEEDREADCTADEEGKRGKDAKGFRMFKFTLVEFVKELLKPTWKEGHMSKEAHKTIVKKVVDKVTSSMQGHIIPQTQEKIDSYLSHSKPKVSKLVQAYLQKYLKTESDA